MSKKRDEMVEKWYQCYLSVSKIHGVGVFARRKIEKGERIWLGSYKDIRWVKKPVNGKFEELCKTYGIETPTGYWIPLDFSRMSLDFFLNHSDDPNVERPGDVVFFAKRDIQKGEEITTDFSKLDDIIDNRKNL